MLFANLSISFHYPLIFPAAKVTTLKGTFSTDIICKEVIWLNLANPLFHWKTADVDTCAVL
jgi:hypothetical protein